MLILLYSILKYFFVNHKKKKITKLYEIERLGRTAEVANGLIFGLLQTGAGF